MAKILWIRASIRACSEQPAAAAAAAALAQETCCTSLCLQQQPQWQEAVLKLDLSKKKLKLKPMY
jgi:hypothetical protein